MTWENLVYSVPSLPQPSWVNLVPKSLCREAVAKQTVNPIRESVYGTSVQLESTGL